MDLYPRVVHIMAGTNDIAFNTGPMSADDTKRNLQALCDIARANKIRIVLGVDSAGRVLSVAAEAGAQGGPALAMNGWIRGYAKAIGATYADYHSAMSNGKGGMKPGLATDEVHPSAEGYELMRPIAEQALTQAAKYWGQTPLSNWGLTQFRDGAGPTALVIPAGGCTIRPWQPAGRAKARNRIRSTRP